jgi:FixJ family two-component response regulator
MRQGRREDSARPEVRFVQLSNKQTAGELGTSETTISSPRTELRKIAASLLAELVKMAGKLRIF